MSIKSFIEGFKKKEYTYSLLEKAINYDVPIGGILEALDLIKGLPFFDVSFGISNYEITKAIKNHKIEDYIIKNKKCVSFTKIYSENYKSINKREIHVESNVFCLGLDNNIWKFTFKSFFIYTSLSDEDYDEKIIDFLIDFINQFIENLDFRLMLEMDLKVEKFEDFNLLNHRKFDGYIKTYGDEHLLRKTGIDFILPKEDNNKSGIKESIHKEYTDENEDFIIERIDSVTTSSIPTETELVTI